MMAEAYGKLTGRPGICFVTRGPGATNASAGVHIAFQDSTPMILFVGQVARGMLEREAFQEIDYRRMFPEMAKWVAQIDQAARIPELVSRAYYTATSGRPGPVVLALPEDMLREVAAVEDARPFQPVETAPGPQAIGRLEALLGAARQPLMILGGGGWTATAAADVQAFAGAFDLPVASSFRCRDYFDNDHASYVGEVGIGIDPGLARRVREADLLLVIGARLGEMTTGGYSLIRLPVPTQGLVHVHGGAEELGRVYQPTLAVHATSPAFAAALRELRAPNEVPWSPWRRDARADFEASGALPAQPGALDMGKVMAWLQTKLGPAAILTNGAGNYTAWPNRYYRFRRYRTQLGPTSGSMGYGVPAAIAAKAVHRERTVVCFAGDGCFLMTGQELATAVQYRLNVIFLVINNGMYGTIRMHQERDYPGRVSGTELVNPDFAAYARAFGAHGEVVEHTEDFAAAFERAQAADRPAILELRIDPDGITPRTRLSEIRARAQAKTA